MKKFLTMLTTVGFLSTSAVTGLLNINQTTISSIEELNGNSINNYAEIYNWSNVKINHNVQASKLLGTDIKDSINVDETTTTESWDNTFKDTKVLIASGSFDLHTYVSPITTNNVLLYLNDDESTDFLRVWDFEQTNQQSAGLIGLGQHISQIKIKVRAQYNQTDGTTLLTVESYIYAKTVLAFNPCSTLSQIENITFLSD